MRKATRILTASASAVALAVAAWLAMEAQAPPPPPHDAHAGTAPASPPRPAVADETVRRPTPSENPPPEEGEPPPATGLTGRIVRADGTPAAGAEIEVRQLLQREISQERAAALGSSRSSDGWFVLMREGTADEEGRFLVVGLAPRPFAVSSRVFARLGDEIAYREAPVPAHEGAVATVPTIALTAGGWIEGVVRTSEGAPVGGVNVVCGGTLPPASARTDAQGRFRIGPLAPGRRAPVVDDDAWACWPSAPSVPVEPGATTSAVVIVHPAGPLRVEVLDEQGRRVEGVEVWVRDGEGRWLAHAIVSHGIVTLSGVAKVERWVSARVVGSTTDTTVHVGPDQSSVTVRMDERTRGTRVSGVVVEAETGEPVAGARVFLERVGEDGSFSLVPIPTGIKPSVETDGEGRFALATTAERARLRVLAEGYEDRVSREFRPPEDRVPLRIELRPATPVELRLVGADGSPVTDATTRLRLVDTPTGDLDAELRGRIGQGAMPSWLYPEVHADSEGVLHFPWLRPGRYRSTVYCGGGISREWECTLVRGRPVRDTLVVAQAGRLRVEVVDPLGRPVAGAAIWARRRGAGLETGTTDEAGVCVLEPVAAGLWYVGVIGNPGIAHLSWSIPQEAYDGPPGTPHLFTVRAGETTTARLVFDENGRGSLRVQLTGEPDLFPLFQVTLAGRELEPGPFGGLLTWRHPDVDGRGTFEETDLPPGRYELVIAYEVGGERFELPHRDVFVHPGEDVTLSVSFRTGSVAGTVRDEEGKPVEGARVHLEQPDPGDDFLSSDPAETETDENGRYRFERAPAGPARIRVSAVPFRQATKGVTIPAGARLEGQDFRLREGGFLRLVVDHPAKLGRMTLEIRGVGRGAGTTWNWSMSVGSSGHAVLYPFSRTDPTAPRTWDLTIQLVRPGTDTVVAERRVRVEDAPPDRNREVHVVFDEL